MTTILRAFFLLGVACALAACSGTGGDIDERLQPDNTSALSAGTPGQYIVSLKAGATLSDVDRLSRGLAHRPAFTYSTALRGFAGTLSAAEVATLKANPLVDLIEPDLPVTINAGKPGGGSPPPETLPWGVNRIDAELNTGTGGAGIGVAVIDTGVDLDHPDLGEVIDGADYIDGLPADDDNGHGSHVAGTIAATDNEIGYIGVAPNATIIAVKVLNRRGSGSLSGVIAGIDWVAANHSAHNIKVANMSLGAYGYSGAMFNAIQTATNLGVTFVVSAGNSSANAANYSPAGFSNVITVSALNPDDTFAYYSNWGSVIDLIAPGTNVRSLWKNGGYNTISGTSMASPHVAGAAALWLDNHSGGFSEVRTALLAAGETGTWVGDPDGNSEKLVDAETL